jgi:hypothetical protein
MKKLPIESVANRWLELKNQIKEAEKELSELKPALEDALKSAPEKAREFHGWRFSLVEFVSESFSLSRAKTDLGKKAFAVFKKEWGAFISKSECSQIRMSFQGGEKKAA